MKAKTVDHLKSEDINRKDGSGYTPLHVASTAEIVKLLVARGADVNAKDKSGKTPLHRACDSRKIELVTVLLANGASVDGQVDDTRGNTPLHLAFSPPDINLAELLIRNGASVGAKNKEGKTPLEIASDNGVAQEKILELLSKSAAGAQSLEAGPASTSSQRDETQGKKEGREPAVGIETAAITTFTAIERSRKRLSLATSHGLSLTERCRRRFSMAMSQAKGNRDCDIDAGLKRLREELEGRAEVESCVLLAKKDGDWVVDCWIADALDADSLLKFHKDLYAYGGIPAGARFGCKDKDEVFRSGTILGLAGRQKSGYYRWRADNQTAITLVDPRPSTMSLCEEFQYAPGTTLLVLSEPGLQHVAVKRWLGAEHGNRHLVCAVDSENHFEVDLNGRNHCVDAFDETDSYSGVRRKYLQAIVDDHAFVEDAITGNKLHTEKQMVFISTVDDTAVVAEAGKKHVYVPSAVFQEGDQVRLKEKIGVVGTICKVAWRGKECSYRVAANGIASLELPTEFKARDLELRVLNAECSPPDPAWTKIQNVRSLAPLLLTKSTTRSQGTFQAQPVLLRAGPGTGKTWAVQQLFYFLAKELLADESSNDQGGGDIPLVPVIVYVQRLARLMRKGTVTARGGMELLLAYVREECGSEDPNRLKMIEQALQMRAVVLLIDGVDEAAGLSQTIEDIVLQHIIPMGLRVVVTSRPEGVRLHLYRKHFVVLNLKPLSDDQQRAVIEGQLGDNPFFEHLMRFSAIRHEHDRLYSQELFPETEQRAEIEGFTVPDLFRLQDGSYDPEARQKLADGSRFIRVSPKGGAAASSSVFLSQLGVYVEKNIEALNALVLRGEDSEDPFAAIASMFYSKFCGTTEKPADMLPEVKVALKLCLLSCKLRGGSVAEATFQLPSSLWATIVERTAEIYVVAEEM